MYNNKYLKFNITDIICNFVIAYPFLYNLGIMISESGGRRLSQLFIILLLLGIINNKNKKEIVVLIIISVLSIYNMLKYGISYVIHLDYYGFIFLLLILCYFSNKNILQLLNNKLIRTRYTSICILLFFITIIFSIFICDGLKPSDEWGVNIPMLFGPFELPHGLAYELMIIYCISSIIYHHTKKIIYLIVMGLAVFCIAWTGVRSAFLAIAFLVIFDYFSMKRTSSKIIITLFGVLVLLYLILCTDFLLNNPIIQKTIKAMNGGSGISNGRGMMNNYLIDVFVNKLSIYEKIFGIGMDELRRYMYLLTATYLHAHNDVFNILIGHGLISLLIFIKQLVHFCNSFKYFKIGIVTFIVLFILIFTNGLYMYVCFTPCLAIILIYSKSLTIKV